MTNEIPFPDDILPLECLGSLDLDFTLIYGDKKYKCSAALAAIFSPKIQNEMLSDILLVQYTIPKVPFSEECSLDSLSTFLTGRPLVFSPDLCCFLYIVSTILGIQYLENELRVYTLSQISSIQFADLLKQTKFVFKNGGNISAYLEAISTEFVKYPTSKMFRKLPVPILDIMFKEYSKIVKEKPIIEFIINIGGRIMRHLQLDTLRQEQLSSIILSKSTNLNYLRKGISEIVEHRSYTPPPSFMRFAYLGNPFSGIINYFSEWYKVNPVSKNIISVSASPHISSSYNVNNIFEFYAIRSSFKTKPNEPMWFTIDFHSPSVQIDAYSIRTFPLAQGSLQPSEWAIYGSLSGNAWDKIDQRKNIVFENSPDCTKTFVMLTKSPKYQYIKFDHPAVKNDKSGLCISSFELFGVFTSVT